MQGSNVFLNQSKADWREAFWVLVAVALLHHIPVILVNIFMSTQILRFPATHMQNLRFPGNCFRVPWLALFSCLSWLLLYFLIPFWPLLVPILKPNLRTRFAQEETRWAQEGHQELQRPKNSLFITLKKPIVFTRFWVQRPPKRASRGPRRLPRGTQRAPKPKEKHRKNKWQKRIPARKCLKPAISV